MKFENQVRRSEIEGSDLDGFLRFLTRARCRDKSWFFDADICFKWSLTAYVEQGQLGKGV